MEKAKKYLYEKLKQSTENRLRHMYGCDWERMFDFYFNASKHQLDAGKSAILDIKEARFHRRRKRLLGNQTKAMPHSIFQQLLEFYNSNDRLHLAILMQGYQGERVNDLLHTKLDQVDFQAHELRCYNHKEQRWYVVPLHPQVEKELKKYISKYQKQIQEHDGYIFFSLAVQTKKKHLSPQFLNRKIVEALEKLGLQKKYAISANGRKLNLYTSHSHRGHAGTYVLEKTNNNYRSMQRILDHMPSSMSSTLLYEETKDDNFFKK